MNKNEIIKNFEIYAKNNGFKLNPNKKLVEFIVESIEENEKKFGQRYCGCRIFSGDNNEDSICPCVWHKEEIEAKSQCHCGLFLKAN